MMTLAFQSWPPPERGVPLEAWQYGRCAFCGESGDLFLDHDHGTGLTRGFLCRSCNTLEAFSGSAEWQAWRSGVNPAAVYGLAEMYVSQFTGQPVVRAPQSADGLARAAAAMSRLAGDVL